MVDFVYGYIPRHSPIRDLLKELDFSITISKKINPLLRETNINLKGALLLNK